MNAIAALLVFGEADEANAAHSAASGVVTDAHLVEAPTRVENALRALRENPATVDLRVTLSEVVWFLKRQLREQGLRKTCLEGTVDVVDNLFRAE